jgi:hypothetical protein
MADKQQHEKIRGYRSLSDEEIALMNEGKDLAEKVGHYVDKLRGMNNLDQRWVNIGATALQQGFMGLVRGVAQPRSF